MICTFTSVIVFICFTLTILFVTLVVSVSVWRCDQGALPAHGAAWRGQHRDQLGVSALSRQESPGAWPGAPAADGGQVAPEAPGHALWAGAPARPSDPHDHASPHPTQQRGHQGRASDKRRRRDQQWDELPRCEGAWSAILPCQGDTTPTLHSCSKKELNGKSAKSLVITLHKHILFSGLTKPEPCILPNSRASKYSKQWQKSGDQRDGGLQDAHLA